MIFDRIKSIGRKNVDFSQSFNMVAIVVKGGNILSIGKNDQVSTHPVYFNGKHDKGIHAEYDAIRQLRHQDISGSKMYVIYFKKSGGFGKSKPCADCQRLIENSGIKSVYYMTEGEFTKL